MFNWGKEIYQKVIKVFLYSNVSYYFCGNYIQIRDFFISFHYSHPLISQKILRRNAT